MEYFSQDLLNNIDHSYEDGVFATSGHMVQIWNYERSHPIQTYDTSIDNILFLRFNPSQENLLAATAVDRSICLFDIRGATPLKKIFLKNKSACLCWNPQEPVNFVVGNEDGNCYQFDMRNYD